MDAESPLRSDPFESALASSTSPPHQPSQPTSGAPFGVADVIQHRCGKCWALTAGAVQHVTIVELELLGNAGYQVENSSIPRGSRPGITPSQTLTEIAVSMTCMIRASFGCSMESSSIRAFLARGRLQMFSCSRRQFLWRPVSAIGALAVRGQGTSDGWHHVTMNDSGESTPR